MLLGCGLRVGAQVVRRCGSRGGVAYVQRGHATSASGRQEERKEYSSGTVLGWRDIDLLKKHGAHSNEVVEKVESCMRHANRRLELSPLKGHDMNVECVGIFVDPNVGLVKDVINPNIRLAFTGEGENRTTLRLRYRSRIDTFGPKMEYGLRVGNCMLIGPGEPLYCVVPPVVEVDSGFEIGLGLISFSLMKAPEWPGRYLIFFSDVMGLSFGVSVVRGGVLYLDHDQDRATEKLRESLLINSLLGQWSKAIAYAFIFLTVYAKLSAASATAKAVRRTNAMLADDDDIIYDEE